MEKSFGNTAGNNKILATIPLHRIWPGLLLLAVAAILVWLGSSTQNQTSSGVPEAAAHPDRSKTAWEMRHSTSRAHIKTSSPLRPIDIELPREIEQYLDAFDEEQIESLLPIACEHIGPKEVDALILRYDLPNATDVATGILALLSNIKNTDALDSAKKIVLQDHRPVDDPILLACATSLAKSGDAPSIQAILERLNHVLPNEPDEIPDEPSDLIHALSLTSAPGLERFIGQAAEGKWIATSPYARLAAVNALRSYPSVHTTSILARLRDSDPSTVIQERAAEVLASIQAQDTE